MVGGEGKKDEKEDEKTQIQSWTASGTEGNKVF